MSNDMRMDNDMHTDNDMRMDNDMHMENDTGVDMRHLAALLTFSSSMLTAILWWEDVLSMLSSMAFPI